MLFATRVLRSSANIRELRVRESVEDANGDWRSPREASLVSVADVTLKPIAQAVATLRVALRERAQLAKFAVRPLLQTINLSTHHLLDVGYDSGLIERFAELLAQ